jgi:hypothetical protein
MPLRGFLCPWDGAEKPFAYCFNECLDRCHPLPVLAGMADDRPHVPGEYHNTEVWNPPKVIYLYRHEDYYVEPESNAYTAFGTAYHLMVERGQLSLAKLGITDNSVIEQSFRAEVVTPHGKATLTGRADRYEPDFKTLWDYKTEKLYSIKKYLAGDWEGVKHTWQLSTYRTFMFPEAEHLRLSCLVKDHGYQAKVRDGIKAIVNVDVPIIQSGLIREVVASKIGILLQNEADPSTIRDCLPEELWGGKRCEEYCAVREFCLQGLANSGTRSGTHGRNKKRQATR